MLVVADKPCPRAQSKCADVLWVCSDDCVDCGTVKGAVHNNNDKKNNSTKHTKLGKLYLVLMMLLGVKGPPEEVPHKNAKSLFAVSYWFGLRKM